MPVFVHVYVHTWVHACQIICVHMRVCCSLFIWMGIHWAAISKLNAFGQADCFTALSCCCEWDAALDGYEDWQDSTPTHTHTHTHTQHFINFHPHSLDHSVLKRYSFTLCLCPIALCTVCPSFFINNFMIFPIFMWFLDFCFVFSLKCIQTQIHQRSPISNLFFIYLLVLGRDF